MQVAILYYFATKKSLEDKLDLSLITRDCFGNLYIMLKQEAEDSLDPDLHVLLERHGAYPRIHEGWLVDKSINRSQLKVM